MNSDCKRPEMERCGVCDVCQAKKDDGMAKELVDEMKKEVKGLKVGCFYVLLLVFGMCAAVGMGIGLVYVGFKAIVNLFGGE